MKNWKYEVYQVPFSVMESLSDEGKPTPFLYWGKDKSDSVYEFSKETARDLFSRHGYRVVARFDVTQLEDIYDLSNNPYLDDADREKRIDRIERMHSVSVGDIILDTESNEYYIVAPFGFDELGKLRRAL
jgi:hypothetical protein